MASRNDVQTRNLSCDHPQYLLMAAYTRLMQLPGRADRTGSTPITTIADWKLRLLELPLHGRADKCSLWVELVDLTAARSIDSRGCHDLDEAGAATEYFLALAQQRHTRRG